MTAAREYAKLPIETRRCFGAWAEDAEELDKYLEWSFRAYRYPEEDRDVADEARLSLVVLDLNQPASEEELAKETEEFVGRILKQHGKGFRKHANALIFLAPDALRASEVTDAARRLLPPFEKTRSS